MLFLPLITLSAQEEFSIRSLDFDEEPSLTKNKKSNQSLFQRNYNLDKRKEYKSDLKLSSDSINNQASSKIFNPGEMNFFEINTGAVRTFSSRGDLGNLYFIGIGYSVFFEKIELSGTALAIGFGRNKEDIHYYNEIWKAGSKTSGSIILSTDIGYNLLSFGNIRVTPTIGLNLISSHGPRSRDIDKYPGLEKYKILRMFGGQLGFDIYHWLMESNRRFIKLKYRYRFASYNRSIIKDTSINQHVITLGINLNFSPRP